MSNSNKEDLKQATRNLALLEYLLMTGFFIISGMMWIATAPNDRWLWFSRTAVGWIMLGIYFCIPQKFQKF